VLFVGDDWAEDHHDVELVDEDGKVLAKRPAYGDLHIEVRCNRCNVKKTGLVPPEPTKPPRTP
jgi:hypothetical protein